MGFVHCEIRQNVYEGVLQSPSDLAVDATKRNDQGLLLKLKMIQRLTDVLLTADKRSVSAWLNKVLRWT